MNNRDCIFCKIVADQLDAFRIAETASALAFLDLIQAQPGHVLVIPKRHYADLYEMPEAEAAAVMTLGHRVARAVRAALQPAGLSVFQSNGAAAGQEVMHMHLHLQPRAAGDSLLRIYPSSPDASGAAELERLAVRIRDRLAR